MQLAHTYYYFKEALDSDTCNRIIRMGNDRFKEIEKVGISTGARTFGGNHKENFMREGNPNEGVARPDEITMEDLKKDTGLDVREVEKKYYVRDSEVCWFNDQWMYDLIYPYLNTANKTAGWHWQFDHSESFQFTKYTSNGFYGWHADGSSDHPGKYKRYIPGITPNDSVDNLGYSNKIPRGFTDDPKMVGKVRKLSMTINLNNPGEYSGGNLKFDFGPHADGERYHECTEIRPQGSIIIFPSFVYHQVTPIEKGTRFSLVLWTLGDPWV